MTIRSSEATWKGNLSDGNGTMTVGEGAYEGPYSFESRFEDGQGTNPEELLAAAHAGCFTMAVSHELAGAGHPPTRAHTVAKVHLQKVEGGFEIPRIDLQLEAEVPGISEDKFREIAQKAKENCPLSKVLSAAEITLDATLVSS